MKKTTIKKHLNAYSIYGKRNSTINHAFASALAPFDNYDENKINEALQFLGQKGEAELLCVFCNNKATSWDHLTGLVKDKQLRGYGYQIGNLVPCCGTCNSQKGSKEFETFIKEDSVKEDTAKTVLINLLNNYQKKFAKEINIQNLENEDEFKKYQFLKEQIFKLMQEADVIATGLRTKILSTKKN